MKRKTKEFLKWERQAESYRKNQFKEWMKRWDIARTFNYKDINFGDCIDEYYEKEKEERRKEKEARRQRK